MRRQFSIVLGCVLVAGAGALTGCGSGDARLDEIRADPSPDIDTLYQRPHDIDNALTVTFDENCRMFWQDCGRVWLLDRPSKLAREPIPRW